MVLRRVFSVTLSLALFFMLSGLVHATVSSVTPGAPANNTWTVDTTPDFSFMAASDTNATFSCELVVDNAGFGVNASVQNDTLTAITANASLEEGFRIWVVSCTDVNGTVSSTQRVVNVDVTSPQSTIDSPANGTSLADATPEIAFTLTDNLDALLNYTVFVDGSAGQNGTASNGTQEILNLSTLTQGDHAIIVQATDETGNSANSTALTLTVDTASPAAAINDPANGTSTNDSTSQINFTLTDSIDTTLNYTVFIDDTANLTGTAANGTPTIVNLSLAAEGVHTVIVQATDEAGNAANSSTLTITIDTTPPGVTSTSPSGTQSTSASSLTVSLQVITNETSTCRYSTSDVSYASMSESFHTADNLTHTASESHSADGSVTWHVRCTDAAGNAMTSSSTISYTVDIGVSSGGGGGGGGSLPPLFVDGSTFSLNKNFGRYAFQHERRTHYLRIGQITNDAVTIVFTSDPVEVTLGEGEERNVDITGDDEDDVSIRLNSFTDTVASLTIGTPRASAQQESPEIPSVKPEENPGLEEASAVTEQVPLAARAQDLPSQEGAEREDALAVQEPQMRVWPWALLAVLVAGGLTLWAAKKR